MKNRTKTLIAGLAVLPVALFAGCGETKAQGFGEDPYAFSNRTYSTQTEITETQSFGTEVAKPTTANGVVSETKNNEDGSKVITMEGVEKSEYEAYRTQLQTAQVTTFTVGNVSVDYDETTKVMTITYTPTGASKNTPSSFRTVNLLDSSKNGMYLRYVSDLSDMLGEGYQGKISIEAAYRKSGDSMDTSVSIGMKDTNIYDKMGDDNPFKGYIATGTLVTLGMRYTAVGGNLYTYTHMDKVGLLPETNTYMKVAGNIEDAEVGYTPSESLGIIGSSFDELLNMYASTGYEVVNDNVYYYEEFSVADEDETSYVKFYFNGNNLIYADIDGMLVEILVSNTIPSYMFETRIPDGYTDLSNGLSGLVE